MPVDFELTPWMLEYAAGRGIGEDRVKDVFDAWKVNMIKRGELSMNWERTWPAAVLNRLKWDKEDAAKQQRAKEREQQEDGIWTPKGPIL
jgi:hypothetical protein